MNVTVVPSTTRGKSIDFAFIQPDRPSARAALGLSKYIPVLTKMGHETVWSPASGQDPMRTVSIKHEGSDAPSGWDSLIVDAIKRQDHAVIMHSFFRNTLSIMLSTTQSIQELACSGVMVDNHFYNITPKKCIQPLWAYALIVVGLAQYHALAGQLAHILQSMFGDRYKKDTRTGLLRCPPMCLFSTWRTGWLCLRFSRTRISSWKNFVCRI